MTYEVIWDGASTRYGEKGQLLPERASHEPPWVEKTRFWNVNMDKVRARKREQRKRWRIKRQLAGIEPIDERRSKGLFFRCRGCRKRVEKAGTRCPACK